MPETTTMPPHQITGTAPSKRKAVTALTALVSLMIATSPVALSGSYEGAGSSAANAAAIRALESFEITGLSGSTYRANEGTNEVTEAEVSTTVTRSNRRQAL